MDKTVCELFAGVGGFRLGLEAADPAWKTVWMNQWEPSRKRQDAYDCYCTHYGHHKEYVNKDIASIDKKTIPNHTLLVGGFPCQDYSVAHTGAKGIEGKKGVLWWQIYDILREKQPPFVFLENVDRLLKSPASQRGRDFGIILASFWALGYDLEWRVINAAEHGFATRRRRTFLFAYRRDTTYGRGKQSPEDRLFKTGFFAKTFPVTEGLPVTRGVLPTKDLARLSSTFHFAFETAGCMKEGTFYTMKAVPSCKGPVTTLGSLLDKSVDSKYNLPEDIHQWQYLKGAKRMERVAKNGHTYIYSEGPVAFPDALDKPARTMLTSEGSVNRASHVICDPETKKLRILTPNEANKIQGFPEHWTDTGMSDRFQYFCMGNALVPGIIERMGRTLGKILETEA